MQQTISSQTVLDTVEEVRRSDDQAFSTCLAYLDRHTAGEVEGVYGPGSMTWRLHQEPSLLTGGIRAILLQLAHPAVAAGVERYSNFRHDSVGRANRTFSTMYHIVFGDLGQAIGAAKRLHHMHNRVRGNVPVESTAASAGRRYRANDPVLLLWVLATLVDTFLLTYEQVIRPLTVSEKERYYEEAKLTAALVGIPQNHFPPTIEAFYDYFWEMLEGAELAVGDVARGHAQALLNSPLTPTKLPEILTAGLLPPRFRKEYRLQWGEREAKAYSRMMHGLRLAHRIIPAHLRAVPAYHQAVFRIAGARGERAPLLAYAMKGINQWISVPLGL